MHPQAILTAILVVTLLLQAAVPRMRLVIVNAGAALACLATSLLGLATTGTLLAEVPWDVLVILVGLGLLSEMMAESRLFGLLAVASTRLSRANPRKVLLAFCVGMYAVSGLVNNLTALILVLPILHILLQLMSVDQRYTSWCLGALLVACNLGGAATPIGDFPAILLLGRGSMDFTAYLSLALPTTLVALVILLLLVLYVVRPDRTLGHGEASSRLSVAVMSALYRNTRLDWRVLAPSAVMLAVMLVGWTVLPRESGMTPELICWLGVGTALLLRPSLGEVLMRRRVDVEAALFLLALFVMVGAVRRSGMFKDVAAMLAELPAPPLAQLLVFLVLAGILTGLFSAGPSMAALLDVAESLAQRMDGPAVYVGLALSVCAGSSLFLTAATSGPMAQALTERAELKDHRGQPLAFGFFHFLPVGMVGFSVILLVGIAFALWRVGF
ncbi:MAG: SLC13 family permease [Myxococcota bacterium]